MAGEAKGIGAAFDGFSVEYVGPGAQHNGTIPDRDAAPRRGVAGHPGVASGRLPKGRRIRVGASDRGERTVSPHVARVAMQHPDRFVVRDKSGKPVNQ